LELLIDKQKPEAQHPKRMGAKGRAEKGQRNCLKQSR